MCSISAFGSDGPLRVKPGYDAVAQAYGGGPAYERRHRPPALIRLSPESNDLGADNQAVVTELAGLSVQRYEELVVAGVLISDGLVGPTFD